MRSKRNKFEHVQGHTGACRARAEGSYTEEGAGARASLVKEGLSQGGILHAEVQCIMGNGHMGTPPAWTERQRLKTLPFHKFTDAR